ncbi:MAG: PAS domain-containing protein, partial [Rubrivivax sp.]|nr:PAS domain-containing protein [Rubrivivax sp.]
MRANLPITQREYKVPDGVTLMSTTDTHSHTRYANGAFIQVSGFERDELMGQPHNLVRHPDMPAQAFADMWRTLKTGQSWTALVKNRRKDGDHYWVRANATPIQRGSRVTGYMSVRTRAHPGEIAAAESLYARFREGRAGALAFDRGLVVHTGIARWRSSFQLLPLGPRLGIGLALTALCGLA